MFWDLEHFIAVPQVSTIFTLNYVQNWHGAEKRLGMNTTTKF